MANEWMTQKDLSDYLQFPESRIQRLMAENQIPHNKTLGTPRFFKSEIDDWMKSGAAQKADEASEDSRYHYRKRPILEYKLSASKVLVGQTPLMRLPGFIRKACSLLDEDSKPYLLREDLESVINNFNDYLMLSCQLGLIDNVRKGKVAHYSPTEFAMRISSDDGIDAVRETIKDCILDIVGEGKEAIPRERHAIYLLWYYLKLKNEGVYISERHYNKGGENTYYPAIRLNYSKGLCEFIFGGDVGLETRYFDAWEKIAGRSE